MSVFIHPSAEVDGKAKLGEGTKVWNQAQIRERAVLGEKCIVGTGAHIGKGVKVGDRVKIENLATLFEGVEIGDDVFIGPHVAFTNDLVPRAFNRDWKVVPTKVEKGASIGTNSTIICGITIGEYSMVGAGSVVTRDVPNHALVYGNPAKQAGFVCRCGHKAEVKSREPLILKCSKCSEEIRV